MSALFRFYAYTDESKLVNLLDYKYHGEDYSLLAKYVMQPFWTWLAQFLPAWLAPNLITLIGLAAMFVGYVAVFLYVPDLTVRNVTVTFFFFSFFPHGFVRAALATPHRRGCGW